jgi:hypothetical protein
LSLGFVLSACGGATEPARAPRSAFEISTVGTVLYFRDHSATDGPIQFILKSDDGVQRKFYFGSVFTRPGPSATKREVLGKLVGTRDGDRVLAEGTRAGDGVLLENFENYSRRPDSFRSTGCGKPAEAPSRSDDGYGYEYADDPLVGSEAADATCPTSCESVRCVPGKVCRVLSMTNPGGVARAYCLGPDDDLCKLDPEVCQDEACRTDPGLCR